MLRKATSKVLWLGRATSMILGLAVLLALILGIATTALGANSKAVPFNLGQINTSNAVSTLVGAVSGSNLKTENTNTDPNANPTALELKVPAGKASVKVNADAGIATNLKAADSDTLDGRDSSSYLPGNNLPSGTTIRGSYGEIDDSAADSLGRASYSPISFGYSIPNLTPHYISVGQPTPQGCTGDAKNPGAQPGHLCVFEMNSFNSSNPQIILLGPAGALVTWQPNNTGNAIMAFGSWAATAP